MFPKPQGCVEPFCLAADAFAEDVAPSSREQIQKVGAAVARIVREPNRAEHLLTEASDFLEGTDRGFVHGQVWRFRLLVDALLQLVRGGELDADRTRKELLGAQRWSGPSSDELIIEQFVEFVTRAFDALRTDPAEALIGSELHIALQTLAQIPLLGSEVATAISPTIGGKAYTEILHRDPWATTHMDPSNVGRNRGRSATPEDCHAIGTSRASAVCANQTWATRVREGRCSGV